MDFFGFSLDLCKDKEARRGIRKGGSVELWSGLARNRCAPNPGLIVYFRINHLDTLEGDICLLRVARYTPGWRWSLEY